MTLLLAQPVPITLSVGTGSITLTWLAARVLYARLCGRLSVSLGQAQAERLGQALEGRTGIHYFADGSRLDRYDPAIGGAFARFLAARRETFASVTLLACREDVRRVVEPLVTESGGLVRLRTHPAVFERDLLAQLGQACPS